MPCAIVAPAFWLSTRLLPRRALRSPRPFPASKLVYADDGETPPEIENYEALLGAQRTDPGCDADRG